MNWFKGSIEEAVRQSKAQNAIFVVYANGSDENSAKIREMLEDPKISNKLNTNDFVAIEINSDTESYMQFAQVYKVVPLPSIFFIGKNGVPITIVTMTLGTIEELEEKINLVLKEKSNPSVTAAPVPSLTIPQPSTSSTANVSHAKTEQPNAEGVVCSDGVCDKQSEIDEKVAKAKELIVQKRKEREEEEAKLEKAREQKRRQQGSDLIDFKRRQEEIEMQEMLDERKRDKLLEQETRKRVLEQIAQDRLERAQKFAPSSDDDASQVKITKESKVLPPKQNDNNGFARIQFKKPTGETEMHIFNITDTFVCVRNYVQNSVLAGTGIKDFSLATTFPKKEFLVTDNDKTMLELSLAPSAVILILTATRKSPLDVIPNSGGLINMFSSIVMGIVNPILALLGTIKNYVFHSRNAPTADAAAGEQKRSNEERVSDNDAAKKRKLRIEENASLSSQATTSKGGAYKRPTGSNIHRLSDNRESDEDDKTWNGNSTQQQPKM